MSRDLEIPPFILHEAQEIEGIDEDQKNHFTVMMNWLVRELTMQLANGYPEAIQVAQKLKAAGKDGVIKFSTSLKIDLTNIEVLAAEAKTGLAPFKWGEDADIVTDLRQMEMDWDLGIATLPDNVPAAVKESNEEEEEPAEAVPAEE